MNDSAVLLIDCPDRKGLVARVSGLLYEHGANILHADQHQDHELGLFFMRVEWDCCGQRPRVRQAASASIWTGSSVAFAPLAAELGMRWTLTSGAHRPRMALFCSQYLHCMADLLHRWRDGRAGLRDSAHRLQSSRGRDAGGVLRDSVRVRAGDGGDPGRGRGAAARTCWPRHGIELVVLARYMQILSPAFVARYPARIINVHHSFLPAFTGARPYHAAHARGVKLIGATSHYVTEVLDDGPSSSRTWRASRTATRWRTWWRAAATWSGWCCRAPCAGTSTGAFSATETRPWCSIEGGE